MKIVRHAIVLAAFCLIALPAVGAPVAVPAFEIGVKGGLSCASFFWEENNSWNDLTMFVFHPNLYAQIAWNISPSLALQLECGYAGRGASIDATNEYAHWYFNYIEVPLWLKFQDRSAGMNAYAGAGGYVAWMLGGDYDFNAPSVLLNGKGPLTFAGPADATHTPRLDFGISGTVGGEFGQTIAELRFAVGIPSVLDFTLIDGARKAINADIQLLMGWRL